MPTLIQTIQADAESKLPLPKERDAPLDLTAYHKFLKVEAHRVKIRHRAGAGGRDICRAQCSIIDALLRNLWQRAKNSLSSQARVEFPPLALVALGGYGREELSPRSDLDVMLLHAGQVVAARMALPHLSKVIDFILTPLFDLRFKVGHSVRTITDCVQIANQDMQTKTSLIEARLIIGDEKLFQRFQKTLQAKCIENHVEEYLEARLKDQTSRRSRYGNSPTMQEPNIKNGCGGLRDFQNLLWMARFRHGTRSMKELQEKEFITATEARQLEKAYDFLMRTRNELHYQVDRPIDTLTKSYQPAVAGKLGFTERSFRKRLESFMKQYYLHSRNIYLITRTVEERLALLPKPARGLPSFTKFIRSPFAKNTKKDPAVDGFVVVEGKLHAVNKRVFRDQPRRLMRVFLQSQQRGHPLHPDTAQMIRNQLPLADGKFIRDAHVHETFLEVLHQFGSVATVLRVMHEVGLLGKYLPEFGRMTCRVQHEFYHQYTADEHTLMCLQVLDEIYKGGNRHNQKYHEIFREVERQFVLYMAMILHDAGKTDSGTEHAAAGGRLAAKVAHRLGLDGATTHTLRLLIEEHLTMAHISQRRDLGDPKVIHSFAQTIQNVENLRMLTLHTYADSLATSDKLWNGFKDSLLWELHNKTREELLGGTGFIRAEAKQKELLAGQVKKVLPRRIHEEEIQAHFQYLPARYYQTYPAQSIARDIALVHRFMSRQLTDDPAAGLEAFVSWHNEPDRGYTSAKICSWDRPGLFSSISGAFAATGINILGAKVFTREDNIVLDDFYVTDTGGGLVGRARRHAFEQLLNQAMSTKGTDLTARLKKTVPERSATETEFLTEHEIWFKIQFDNRSSENRTVIEIQTEDRPSLLYYISRTLTDFGLNIHLAKIVTDMGGAVDSFYVTEEGGGKISSAQRQREVETALRKALG